MNQHLKPNNTCHCSDNAPKFLQIKMNNRCNGNCWFCIDKNNLAPQKMNVDKMISATLSEEEYQVVSITGGEPFLDFDVLLTLLKGIRPYKKEIIVNTNGSIISKDKVEKLNSLVDELRIALHHYDEEINSSIIGTPVRFSKIQKSLLGKNFKVTFNMTITSAMENNTNGFVDELTQLCHMLNVDGVKISELKYTGNSDFYPKYANGHIEAYHFFKHLNVIEYKDSKDLITKGCVDIFIYKGIEFLLKRLCGYKIVPQLQTFKVVYSNGEKADDWIYNFSNL